MWAELFYYLTKTKGVIARKTGHKNEMASYMARYRREKKFWDEHFRQCHQAINQFINENPNKRTRLLILGAGEMFDIPSEIFNKFNEVIAFDIVETARVKEITKKYPHVKFQEADLSHFFKPWEFALSPETDLVLSMNVLSQLPLIPLQFLQKKKSSERELEILGNKIITDHLKMLSQASGLLIADLEWTVEGEVYDPYFEATWDVPHMAWTWRLDCKRQNRVGVWKTKNFFQRE